MRVKNFSYDTVCCILGVAPTIWPVFKSCITSPAIAAEEATIEAINIVASIKVGVDKPNIRSPIIQTRATVNSKVAIVMPDTGELEEPTTPAIYPATAAKKKAVTARKAAPAKDRMNEPVFHQ